MSTAWQDAFVSSDTDLLLSLWWLPLLHVIVEAHANWGTQKSDRVSSLWAACDFCLMDPALSFKFFWSLWNVSSLPRWFLFSPVKRPEEKATALAQHGLPMHRTYRGRFNGSAEWAHMERRGGGREGGMGRGGTERNGCRDNQVKRESVSGKTVIYCVAERRRCTNPVREIESSSKATGWNCYVTGAKPRVRLCPEKCRFVCVRDASSLFSSPILLTRTVDRRLQAQPGEKKNRLGRPSVGHLFPWKWSVWIRPVCLPLAHRRPSSSPSSFSWLPRVLYFMEPSASGCPGCPVPWPCVWTSVQRVCGLREEEEEEGRRRRRRWWWWGGLMSILYPLAMCQEAAFIILAPK